MEKSKLNRALIIIGGLVLISLAVFALVKCTGGGEEHSVAFDSNGGTVISAVTVKKDGVITHPEEPLKEGFVFSHWESEGKSFDFSEPITGDITLKAIWEPVAFTVKFDANGGSQVEDQLVAFGKNASKPADPTCDNRDFTGWFLNDKAFKFSQVIDKDLTLLAGWQEVKEVIGEPTPQPEPTAVPTPEPTFAPTPTARPTSAPTKPAKPTTASTTTTSTTKPTTTSTTKPTTTSTTASTQPTDAPVYTIRSSQPDEFLGSPQWVITVYKDKASVSAKVVYSGNYVIGDTNNDKGLLLVNKSEIGSIDKAKLADGTVVTIKR